MHFDCIAARLNNFDVIFIASTACALRFQILVNIKVQFIIDIFLRVANSSKIKITFVLSPNE